MFMSGGGEKGEEFTEGGGEDGVVVSSLYPSGDIKY